MPEASKKPYKIVLESVTQEKKKLRSFISYRDEAPPGYTFVPVGTPDLTEFCKELSRQRGISVYVVSSKPSARQHRDPGSLSHHIHRIGHHFDNKVVEQACDWQGYHNRGNEYVKATRAVDVLGHSSIARRLDRQGKRLGFHGHNLSVEDRDRQVGAAIRDLFPLIPEWDVSAIIARAFEEGSGRVGSAPMLPMARKVQLAVLAHIRHQYTEYDQLLRLISWHEARQRVQQPCLDLIVKWRGEDDTGVIELEDIFREVIVLDGDDGDEGDDDEVEEQVPGASSAESEVEMREASLEIISCRQLLPKMNDDFDDQEHAIAVRARNKAVVVQQPGQPKKASRKERVHDLRKANKVLKAQARKQAKLQKLYDDSRKRNGFPAGPSVAKPVAERRGTMVEDRIVEVPTQQVQHAALPRYTTRPQGVNDQVMYGYRDTNAVRDLPLPSDVLVKPHVYQSIERPVPQVQASQIVSTYLAKRKSPPGYHDDHHLRPQRSSKRLRIAPEHNTTELVDLTSSPHNVVGYSCVQMTDQYAGVIGHDHQYPSAHTRIHRMPEPVSPIPSRTADGHAPHQRSFVGQVREITRDGIPVEYATISRLTLPTVGGVSPRHGNGLAGQAGRQTRVSTVEYPRIEDKYLDSRRSRHDGDVYAYPMPGSYPVERSTRFQDPYGVQYVPHPQARFLEDLLPAGAAYSEARTETAAHLDPYAYLPDAYNRIQGLDRDFAVYELPARPHANDYYSAAPEASRQAYRL